MELLLNSLILGSACSFIGSELLPVRLPLWLRVLLKPMPVWLLIVLMWVRTPKQATPSQQQQQQQQQQRSYVLPTYLTWHKVLMSLALLISSSGDIFLLLHDHYLTGWKLNHNLNNNNNNNNNNGNGPDAKPELGRFIGGIASFLIAHLFYVCAFSIEGREQKRPDNNNNNNNNSSSSSSSNNTKTITTICTEFVIELPQRPLLSLPFVLIALLVLGPILGNIDMPLLFPVLLYASVISTFGWRAAARVFRSTLHTLDGGSPNRFMHNHQFSRLAGALIFIASDSAIALTTFGPTGLRERPTAAMLFIMITYYLAQYLLTFSVMEYVHVAAHAAKEKRE